MTPESLEDIEDLVIDGRFLDAAKRFALATRAISPRLAPDAYRKAQRIRSHATALAGTLRQLEDDQVFRLLPNSEYAQKRNSMVVNMLELATATRDLYDDPQVVPPVPEPKSDVQMPKGWGTPERVTGRPTLQSIAWMSQGVTVGRAVVRVIPPKAVDVDSGIGTGFLLPGGWVMTNEHVVSSSKAVAQTRIEMNFERNFDEELQPTHLYAADPDGMISLPLPFDCTLFRVRAHGDAPPLSHWGALQLEAQRLPKPLEPLNIIQHPGAGEKKIAVTSNQCVSVNDTRLTYMTDTEKGSSGAPVFDETWRVVGLHRASGNPEYLPNGQVVHPNEGVVIPRILAHPALDPIRKTLLSAP